MMEYNKPVPVPSLESAPYWEGVRQHKLLIPRCSDCARFWFPPSRQCPHCLSDRFSWLASGGTGKVFSFVIFERVYHPGFADAVPYIVALIELDEGPRMLCNVIDVPFADVRCEIPVKVVFEDVAEGVTLPKFKPI